MFVCQRPVQVQVQVQILVLVLVPLNAAPFSLSRRVRCDRLFGREPASIFHIRTEAVAVACAARNPSEETAAATAGAARPQASSFVLNSAVVDVPYELRHRPFANFSPSPRRRARPCPDLRYLIRYSARSSRRVASLRNRFRYARPRNAAFRNRRPNFHVSAFRRSNRSAGRSLSSSRRAASRPSPRVRSRACDKPRLPSRYRRIDLSDPTSP